MDDRFNLLKNVTDEALILAVFKLQVLRPEENA
jgi:hypothetical protein